MFRGTNYWLSLNFLDTVKLRWGVASSQINNTNDLSIYMYTEHGFDSPVESVILTVVGVLYPHTKGCMHTPTPTASRTMQNRTERSGTATKLSCASQHCSFLSVSANPLRGALFPKVLGINLWPNIKKNEITPFAEAWMDLENVILSEVSQTVEKCHWHPFYVESKKKRYRWTYFQNGNRLTEFKNELILAEGRMG